MKFLLTLALAGYAFLVYPNENPIQIKGIIKDIDTNESIPFAHVLLDGNVTISNINGEFSISMDFPQNPEAFTSFQISYLGYEPYEKIIDDYNTYHEVFLVRSMTVLDEVTVTSGPSIMSQVFNKIHLNYIMEPLHMETYYLESLRDTLGFDYVAEGILDVYTPSNVDRYNIPWVHLQQSRKRIYKPIDYVNFLAGNASDMAHHSIWRHDSFLSKRNRDKYEYYYDGTSKIGNHNVLIVKFEPKTKKGNTTGKLYIDDVTYAILKMEYYPITTRSEFWDYVYWTEEFELIDGRFELVNVSYEGHADKNEKKYKAVLVINNSTIDYEIPQDKILLGNEVSLMELADDSKSSEIFWKGYYAIKYNQRVANQITSDRYGFD